jgi:hypothetical protein
MGRKAVSAVAWDPAKVRLSDGATVHNVAVTDPLSIAH